MNQTEKAIYFKSLHKKHDPLVLYNIWDAGGAKALKEAGSKASATGSWSVAAAQGYEDGEAIPLDFVVQIIARISTSVDLPLSVDFEGGYAIEPEKITENVTKIINAGAIGINFEDRIVRGKGLYSVSVQVERIKAVRQAAKLANIPLFINARTDLFLGSDQNEHEALIGAALEREAAYAEAGADGFFVPGLSQLPLIERIVQGTSSPVNVMMKGELNSITDVANIGVARASFGPGPYFTAMSDLTKHYTALR